MNKRGPLSLAGKVAVAGLVVAAVGVVIQIASGHEYPPIPPVFFILLIPAGLVAFGRWRWAAVPAVLAGLFLTFGLFASGESARLFDLNNIGDSAGLWIQTVAVVVATVAAIVASVPLVRQTESMLMAKIVSRIVGVLYVVAGVAGLVLGEDADRYHNLLHLLTGLFALYVGFVASLDSAKYFCLATGSAYLAFGVLGMVVGNPTMDRAWNIGLMTVSRGDHVHHVVLGTIILAGGIITTLSSSRARSDSLSQGQPARS